MKVEVKTKIKPKFVGGDIIAMKVDSNFNRTKEVHYYLLGICDNGYCLTDIKTGALSRLAKNNSDYFDNTSLASLLNLYGGKIYSGSRAKLVIARNR